MNSRLLLTAGVLTSLFVIFGWAHLLPYTKQVWLDIQPVYWAMIVLEAELTLATAWIVLGPGSVFMRTAGGLIWLPLIWVTAFQIAHKLPLFSDSNAAVVAASVALLTQLVTVCPFWFLLRVRGYRAEVVGWPRTGVAEQFSLLQVFGLVTFACVLFAVIRLGTPTFNYLSIKMDKSLLQTIFLIVLCGALLALPTALALLRPSARSIWLLPYFIAICVGQAIAFGIWHKEFTHKTTAAEMAYAIVESGAWNALQLVPVAVSFMLVRVAGIRLVKLQERLAAGNLQTALRKPSLN